MTDEWDCELRKSNTSGSTAFLVLPFDPVEILGSRRAPVVVTVNGYSFTGRVQMYGGVPHVAMRKEHRDAAKVEPGSLVRARLVINPTPDAVDVPPELTEALSKVTGLAAFAELAPSHQREWARYVADAKQEATRRRRADKVARQILGG